MTYFLLSFSVNVPQVSKFKLFALVYRLTHHRTFYNFFPLLLHLHKTKSFLSFFPEKFDNFEKEFIFIFRIPLTI